MIKLNYIEDFKPYLQLDKSVYVIIREPEWGNPFWKKHFKPVATETRLKKIRLNKETLNKFWQQGIETTLNQYKENVLLLTKR